MLREIIWDLKKFTRGIEYVNVMLIDGDSTCWEKVYAYEKVLNGNKNFIMCMLMCKLGAWRVKSRTSYA